MSSTSQITDVFKAVKRPGGRQPAKKDIATDVHTTGKENPDLQLLKQFDLTLEYGPCVGITRLERWERAAKHGMDPPQKVREIIEQNKDKPEFLQCLWKDYEIY